jgi:hypothetical protein
MLPLSDNANWRTSTATRAMNSSSRKEVIATAVSRRFNLGFFARK